jgi:sugar lactone lactonase YvrE
VSTLYSGGDPGSLFDEPTALALGSDCSIFVADGQGNLAKFDAQGNGTSLNAEVAGGATIDIAGLTVDALGNLYFADLMANRVQKVDPSGNVTTLAGNGAQGSMDGSGGPDGGAEFGSAKGLAVDPAGNVYVADTGNKRIRKIDPSGNVTTLTVNGEDANACGVGGPDGPADDNNAIAVAVDGDGNVFVADDLDPRICKIDRDGNVTTVVDLKGSRTYEFAAFGGYQTLTIGSDDSLYVADEVDEIILKIDSSGDVATLAGTDAQFYNPLGVVVDGNAVVYVADSENAEIRKIVP